MKMLRFMTAGTVLITFKSPRSIPPYRIENQCDDVYVYFAQSGVAWDRAKWNWLQPRLGGARMAYAWDEPILEHKLTIQVGNCCVPLVYMCILGRECSASPFNRLLNHQYSKASTEGICSMLQTPGSCRAATL